LPAPPNALQLCSDRGFSYSVFISWPHEISDRGREIVSKLVAALGESYRNFPGNKDAGIFFDERLETGYRWNQALRRNLCRSALTLVILVPTYFASEYCSLEWGITEKLEPFRIPGGADYTSFISIRLVPVDELNPPAQVAAVQFAKEFEDLLVWGRDVETHPNWRKTIEELRQLVFKRIKQICATNRDAPQWDQEEKIAQALTNYEFTWPQDPPPTPDPSFPKLRAVEKKP
jgi:hypothetical protein